MLSNTIQTAIICINELRLNEHEPKLLKATDISGKHGLSNMFVEQILGKLRRANIVKAQRGPGGGYSLKTNSISLHDLKTIFTSTKDKTPVSGMDDALHSSIMNRINDTMMSICI